MLKLSHSSKQFLSVCLIPIVIAGERLRRSPDLVCVVEPALRAGSTTHTKSFARLRRASNRRERVKPLRIRHALSNTSIFVLLLIILCSCNSSTASIRHITPRPTYSLSGGGRCVALGQHVQPPYTNI